MENNIGIMCYQSLLEMETKNQKINEMIMAPKFAKLLNESVDQDDLSIHRAKTIEIVSEFVNKSLDNTTNLLDSIIEQLESITTNNRLITACEMKMKSLTRDDRNNFVLENSSIIDSIYETKVQLSKDIDTINKELCKILETSFESKEEYSKTMNSFRSIISECVSRLDKIDISTMERTNVGMQEFTDILSRYKNTKDIMNVNEFGLSSINGYGKYKNSIKPNNLVKVREAVHLGTEYLMRANSMMDKLLIVSHENTEDILSEFVRYEVSNETAVQFESAMENIIRQNSLDDDDYDDFIK